MADQFEPLSTEQQALLERCEAGIAAAVSITTSTREKALAMRRTVSAERWNQLIRQWRQRQERTKKREAREDLRMDR